MLTPVWQARFLDLATVVAGWSKDPGTRCGAVVVDPVKRIVSTGYNGLPRLVRDLPERVQDRAVKLRLTLHAEENAMAFARASLVGHTIVVTAHPCAHCASLIVQYGLTSVYFATNRYYEERWGEDISLASMILHEVGINCVRINT